ncbi:MAG: diaminopimelate decarboxylase [Clostridia bacterium]|nr:diaminopimelate decarboxylase [Clostridia bacterium]
MSVNNERHLVMGGCDMAQVAQKYGTPLYVMDENVIRANCRVYKNAIDTCYSGNGLILYASKALCNLETVRIVASEGLGIDVVSGGELYTALRAGMDVSKICMHGNNKTRAELEMAISSGVGRIVVDNLFELDQIDAIAAEHGVRQKVLFRIKPGIDAHTHNFVMTGQIDSRFGFALETGEARAAILRAFKCNSICVAGVHCHIGSQIFEADPFEEAARVLMRFIAEIRDESGVELTELNLGGGFGVVYTPEDDPIEFGDYIEAVSRIVKTAAVEHSLKMPFIMMEPGRSIVAEAGITLYTVGAIKDIPEVRRYVTVDGGIGDNPRYILYGSKYAALIANKADAEVTQSVTIAGKCCESGDLIGENMPLADVSIGDILALLTTGAYNYSMSSNYNRNLRPAMVMVKDGRDRLVMKRETYEDIIRNDV